VFVSCCFFSLSVPCRATLGAARLRAQGTGFCKGLPGRAWGRKGTQGRRRSRRMERGRKLGYVIKGEGREEEEEEQEAHRHRAYV
jgi:hypothetical protein